MIKTKNIILGLGIVAGLGVSALSLNTQAALNPNEGQVDVTVNVGSETTLTITDGTAVSISMQANELSNDKTSTINVKSNLNGYKLTVEDAVSGRNAALKHQTSGADDTIDSITASNSVSAGSGTWGVKVGEGDTFAVGANGSPTTLKTTDSVTGTSGDTTVVTYLVGTKDAQAAGDYKASIIYKAVAKS